MEAASARLGARGQFDHFMEPPKSTLQRYIYSACDPMANSESKLPLHLEIADLINAKKAGAPREAAVTIVNFINNRNANVSLLALALLDICVKNCGYPFHLQISTKEFLNELVRRFPERPPARPTRVQSKILEAIEEWRQTICQTSKYKDDLGYIRDMHRLLLYKGYIFPEVRREDAAVLNPSDNLKSAEEMEEEERAAQSAKLQELIRRGGPQDLQEANKLMKVMAGYDTRHKTDYRAKAAEEVSKVQQKAKILEDMLQNHKPGDRMEEGDVFEELVNALRSAHPKIQRMCEEESDDQEAVAKLLEINDSIHRTIERYQLTKAGDVEAASRIPKGTLGTTTGVKKNAANELSLIDFDPEPRTKSASNQGLLDDSNSTAPPTTLENDLLDLSMDDQPFGQMGGINLGPGTSKDTHRPDRAASAFLPVSTTTPSSIPFSSPPQSTSSNHDAFASLVSNAPTTNSATPAPTQPHLQKQLPHQHTAPADPFAALVSSGSRSSTPLQHQNKSKPALASTLATHSAGKDGTAGDDDWNFASSLPEPALPASNKVRVHTSHVEIDFSARRQGSQNAIQITARFTNGTAEDVTGLHFQVAVEKGYSLQLKPQSGRDLAPHRSNVVEQEILLNGVPPGKGSSVKIRYRVSYQRNMLPIEEQGNVPPLGIA